jgi:hypothetical protein
MLLTFLASTYIYSLTSTFFLIFDTIQAREEPSIPMILTHQVTFLKLNIITHMIAI